MPPAEQHQVAERGRPALCPVLDVVPSQRVAAHPGKRQCRSRAARARRRADEMVRVRRPTSRTSPPGPCRMVTVAASQASRRAVSAETWMPPASSRADWPPAGPGQAVRRRRGGPSTSGRDRDGPSGSAGDASSAAGETSPARRAYVPAGTYGAGLSGPGPAAAPSTTGDSPGRPAAARSTAALSSTARSTAAPSTSAESRGRAAAAGVMVSARIGSPGVSAELPGRAAAAGSSPCSPSARVSASTCTTTW